MYSLASMNPQKLKILQPFSSWEERAKRAAAILPIKALSHLPSMPGITKKTAKWLKTKSLFYLLRHDKNKIFQRYFWKRPFKYGLALLKSYVSKTPYTREGDLFFYGVKNLTHFKEVMLKKDLLLVVGFSYCHKPFECPSGRFSSECIHSLENLVCQQCFIGQMVHSLPPKNVIPLFIPTIHYIGEKMFEIIENNSDKNVLFLITACELTLHMFADWGNMLDVQGIGIRLEGRICNTLKAFELSENGIKPGLTVVLPETQKIMLDLIRHFRDL